ncbi:MAG: YARHG domain-containing protein [Myxococcota bacterium]
MLPTLLLMIACDGGSPSEHGDNHDAQPTAAAPPAPAAATANAAPAGPPGQLPGYDGRFANDPLLTPADVAMSPPNQLRVMRNEVFARYGRAFKSEDLQQHFGATSWYTVNPGFSDSVLTKNDQANIALIASFEGNDGAKKVVQRGEYNDSDSMALMFVDNQTAEIIDQSGDIYDWNRESRNYVAMGDWVITWEGPARWNPNDMKNQNVQLWKLDHNAGTITSHQDLQPRRG